MQIFTRLARSRSGSLTAGTALALGAALAALESRPAAAQAPEVGIWINHEGKGAVEIKPCGAALCGNIVWLREPVNDQGQPLFDRRNPDEGKRNRPICGLPVIGSVKRTSEGWDDGWIYNPEEGAQYDVYLKASGDRLTVTGYKGVKLFSKTFTWTRAPADLQRCDGAKQTKAKPPMPPVKAATTPEPNAAPAAKPAVKAAPPPATKTPAMTTTAAPTQAKAPAAQKAPPPARAVAKDGAKPLPAAAAKSSTPAKATTAKGATAAKPQPQNPVAAKPKPAPVQPTTAAATDKKAPAKKAAAPGAAPAAAKAAAKPAVAKKKAADEAETSSAVE